MFDLGVYVSGLIAIIVGYLTLSIPLRKERNDLDISNATSKTSKEEKQKQKKKKNINKTIRLVNILFALISVIITFLYFFNDIKNFFVTVVFPMSKSFINALCSFFLAFRNIIPFKKGFFSDGNFTFSYISETVLMAIAVLFLMFFIFTECHDLWNYFITIIISISICIGLIWLNIFLSNFLCSSISRHFIFIALILNIVAYLIIGLIIYLIGILFSKLFCDLYAKKMLRLEQVDDMRKQCSPRNSTSTSNNSSIKEEVSQNRRMSADEILLERYLNKELGLDGKKSQ